MNNLSDFEKMMLIFIVMSVSGSVANTSHIFINYTYVAHASGGAG